MWKYLNAVFRVGFRLLFANMFFFRKYGKHPERYPKEERYACASKYSKAVIDAFNGFYKIENKELFDESIHGDRKVLLIGNHASFCDILSLMALSDVPLTFVAKKETEKMPMARWVAKMIDAYLMDRSDLKQSLRIIRNAQNDLKNNKHNIAIFPEGTRNKDPNGQLLPMHPGSLKCAMGAKADILIFASFGNHRILDPRSKHKRELIQYRFIRRIPYDEYKDMNSTALIQQCQNEIQQAVDELKQNDCDFYKGA